MGVDVAMTCMRSMASQMVEKNELGKGQDLPGLSYHRELWDTNILINW